MKNLIIASVLVVLAIAFYLGFGQPVLKKTGPTEAITIADGTLVNSAPVYVAVEKGYFKRHGLDVLLRAFPTGKRALDEVLEGKATLATVADVPIMFEAMKGRRIAILATISSTAKVYAVVARKDKNIFKPDDLRGRKIGVVKGTGGEFFLDTFLVFSRVPRSEIRFVPIDFEKTFDALMNGEVDAVSTWDPYLERLRRELGDKAVTFYGAELYQMPWNVVVMQDLAANRPDIVRKILQALLESEAFIREHSDESRRITAHYLKTDETSLDESWNWQRFKVNLSMPLLLNLEDGARWAIKNGLTEGTTVPNFLNFMDLKALESLKPGAVSIVHP